MTNQLFPLAISTTRGRFIARYSSKGLAELKFPGREALVAPKRSEGGPVASKPRENGQIPDQILRWHRMTAAALKSSLAGRKPRSLPPLDLAGTEFQKRVWKAMRNISAGKTKSYGEIARVIGKPKAVRAVGGACGANPLPIFVPCHRVLAANKKLGGFSGGLDWKRTLLAREGIKV